MNNSQKLELPNAVARGVVAGEHGAIAEAYSLLGQRVMNLATRILRDRGQAEEVVQDTFIELVEKSTQIRDANAIPAWVKRVAVNHCLMRLRSPWHARRVDVEAEVAEDAQQQQTSVDEALDWVINVPTLEGALSHLSEDARTVLWLHDVEGYTHKEIGVKMGRTTSFSKSQLARAYEKLLQWRRAHVESERTGEEKQNPQTRHREPLQRAQSAGASARTKQQQSDQLSNIERKNVMSKGTTQVKNEDEKDRNKRIRTTHLTPTYSA